MKIILIGIGFMALGLAACQSTHQYNGNAGYEVESQNAQSAIIRYTMSAKISEKAVTNRLLNACQKTLGRRMQSPKILSTTEIANNGMPRNPYDGMNIGATRAQFSLSNTPDSTSYTTSQTLTALDAKPSTLKVIRAECH